MDDFIENIDLFKNKFDRLLVFSCQNLCTKDNCPKMYIRYILSCILIINIVTYIIVNETFILSL